MTPTLPPISKLPEKKTSMFLFGGVILYLGSVYLNTLKPDSAWWGVLIGIGLIVLAASVQIALWVLFIKRKIKENKSD
jgi:hypothetical protein